MSTLTTSPIGAENGHEQPQQDAVSLILSFATRKTATVSWEYPPPGSTFTHADTYRPQKDRFIKALKENYSTEAVYESLKLLITDETYQGGITRSDKPFILCYAAHIFKEFPGLIQVAPPEDLRDFFEHVLKAYEGSYHVRCPAKDTQLVAHYNSIRRDAEQGLGVLVEQCPAGYLPVVMGYLQGVLAEIERGNGLVQPLKWHGQIVELKALIYSLLAKRIHETSLQAKESLTNSLILALQQQGGQFFEKGLNSRALELLVQAHPEQAPTVLIEVAKLNQHGEPSGTIGGFPIYAPPSEKGLLEMLAGIPNEHLIQIRSSLKGIMDDEAHPDREHARTVVEQIDKKANLG